MDLFIATKNEDKIKEIEQLLANLPIKLFSIKDFPDIPDVVEDKETIEENACKKALEIAKIVKMKTIADDTGFFIEALNGKPGVFAARYAGENCSYEDNRKKVLTEMENCRERKAYFRTVIAFVSPEKIIHTFIGEVSGTITKQEIGESGFGYDPIFQVEETGKTFAEMTDEEKNKISHRGKALQKFINYIKKRRKE